MQVHRGALLAWLALALLVFFRERVPRAVSAAGLAFGVAAVVAGVGPLGAPLGGALWVSGLAAALLVIAGLGRALFGQVARATQTTPENPSAALVSDEATVGDAEDESI